MTTQASGYSGTPLVRKLGIKGGARVFLVGAPVEYAEWLEPLPAGVCFTTRPAADTDMAHVFATARSDLVRHLASLRKSLRPDAMLWVSWPKRVSKMPTDITEDTIREVALPLGFVDVKVCAVTEVWSGLKLVVRKELR
jgi:hypothetical protein